MNKFDVAREQLVTALDLFLCDRSPVSVPSLAGNAREMLERQCEIVGKERFTEHALREWPEMKREEFYRIVHIYRNAFKHSRDEDVEILGDFSDGKNDHMLLIAINDYRTLTGRLTISMQIFYQWYFSTYPEKVVEHKRALWEKLDTLRQLDRHEQKRRLRHLIERASRMPEIVDHPDTER